MSRRLTERTETRPRSRGTATKLQRKMIRPGESARGNENLSTPREAAALMERIFRCDLPLGPAECRELRDILEIPHEGPIREAVPSDVTVGQKTGTITGVRVNWGYVDLPGRPYVVTATGNYGDSERLSQAIREVADAVHGYFGKLAGATQYGTRVPVRLLEVRPRPGPGTRCVGDGEDEGGNGDSVT